MLNAAVKKETPITRDSSAPASPGVVRKARYKLIRFLVVIAI